MATYHIARENVDVLLFSVPQLLHVTQRAITMYHLTDNIMLIFNVHDALNCLQSCKIKYIMYIKKH